jgi:two-component system, NarL family, nitrate/nitrite response regulator NarL
MARALAVDVCSDGSAFGAGATAIRGERVPIPVIVCTPTRLYREGLRDALQLRAGVAVVGTARGLDDCLALAGRERPCAVLVDTSLVQASLTIRRLRNLPYAPEVVALGVPDAEDAVLACVEAGAAAFVTVEESVDDLVATVVRLSHGEALASPRVVAALLRRISHLASARATGDAAALTTRELQVGALLGSGLSNKEIASELQIEPATVKNHVHSVLAKLGVTRRSQVGARLRELGFEPHSSGSV